jgi:hypothetical protein
MSKKLAHDPAPPAHRPRSEGAAAAPASGQNSRNIRHAWPWTTLAPILGVLAVFALTILDPLGFESVTKSQSSKIFYKIYAAAYPPFMRDDISVVLLDNNTVEKTFGDSWPPSHQVHGEILKAILSFKPAAVLIDLVFIHDSTDEDLQSTKDIAQKYHDKNVSLFLIVPGASTGAHRLGRLYYDDKFKENINFVSAELEEEPGQVPLYSLDRDTDGDESAALALYHRICRDHLVRDATCPDTASSGRLGIRWLNYAIDWLDERVIRPLNEHVIAPIVALLSLSPQEKFRIDHQLPREMEVVWGLSPAPLNCQRAEANSDVSNLRCKDLGLTWLGRAEELLWAGIYPAQHRDTDPVLIPYHAEISTTDLLKGANHEDLAQALTGKVVIYGSQVAPRKDLVLSPVHGKIDGAFIHAMALDNLLTWGEQSVIRRAPEGWFHKDWTEFEPFVLMALVAFAVAWHRRILVRGNSRAHSIDEIRRKDEWFLHWLSPRYSYPVVIILGLCQFFIWGIAPFNWLGTLIVIHVVHRIDRWFFYIVEREAADAGWRQHQEAPGKSPEKRAA